MYAPGFSTTVTVAGVSEPLEGAARPTHFAVENVLGLFAEYFDPFTGDPLGSPRQSWTAAVTLDWLG